MAEGTTSKQDLDPHDNFPAAYDAQVREISNHNIEADFTHDRNCHGSNISEIYPGISKEKIPVHDDIAGVRLSEDDKIECLKSTKNVSSDEDVEEQPNSGAYEDDVTDVIDQCPVCLEDVHLNETLKCGHRLCTRCRKLLDKPKCPVCRETFGIIEGTMPPGTMSSRTEKWPRLPGYESVGIIIIDYRFESGIQTADHPNPGRRYKGTSRRAYLPDTDEGRKVLRLLRRAFDARLTFTVGTSLTTGARDAVTWNDVHHKTSRDGGPERFGYLDPDYLWRVQEELEAHGIVD